MPLAIRMWSFQHSKCLKLAELTHSVQHQGLAQPSISMTVMDKFSKQSKALKIGSRSEEFRKFKLLGHTAAIVSTRKETFGEVAAFAGTPCTSFISLELLKRTTNIQQSSKVHLKTKRTSITNIFQVGKILPNLPLLKEWWPVFSSCAPLFNKGHFFILSKLA